MVKFKLNYAFVAHSKIKRTYRKSMLLVFYTNNLNTNRFVGICISCKFKCLNFSTSKKRIFYKYDFPLLYFQSHLTTKGSNFTSTNRRNILLIMLDILFNPPFFPLKRSHFNSRKHRRAIP